MNTRSPRNRWPLPQMQHQPPPETARSHTARSFDGLLPLRENLQRFHSALKHLSDASEPGQQAQIAKLRKSLRDFEPSVTLIGQVKAGKTSLVNALVGRPDLLPSDINPWTSVITSLHIGPAVRSSSERAQFHFFSEREWQNLLIKGGRVGELASRAGAEEELEKVRAQLTEMRAQSKARLGDKFEMLLGQTHSYGYVDADLVQRYVCLGDTFEDAGGQPIGQAESATGQGRFADITKSADLYLHQPDLPIPLCLRDTPGVNDTFLVREQITVNALRASRLCVLVLSAHQALSSVDMALIRLISNIKSRSVILFVNRIDELADPVNDIPQIRDSILSTLARHHRPENVDILFGSAHWANAVLTGHLNELPPASTAALMAMAKAGVETGLDPSDPEAMIWSLSGLPALGTALAGRIKADEGQAHLTESVAAAQNVLSGLRAADQIAQSQAQGQTPVPRPALMGEIGRLRAQVLAHAETQFDTISAHFDDRLGKATTRFVSHATASLIAHLEAKGDAVVWTYDPSGLRMLLRAAYQVFAQKAERAVAATLQDSAKAIETLGQAAFDLPASVFKRVPPAPPAVPPPVLLGQTIALDIKGNWWTRWWRKRRSAAALTADFSALIEAEISPVVEALRFECSHAYRATCLDLIDDFLSEQTALLLTLADQSEAELAGFRSSAREGARDRAHHLAMAERMLASLTPLSAPKPEPSHAI